MWEPWAPYNGDGPGEQDSHANVRTTGIVLYCSSKCANVSNTLFYRPTFGNSENSLAHLPLKSNAWRPKTRKSKLSKKERNLKFKCAHDFWLNAHGPATANLRKTRFVCVNVCPWIPVPPFPCSIWLDGDWVFTNHAQSNARPQESLTFWGSTSQSVKINLWHFKRYTLKS